MLGLLITVCLILVIITWLTVDLVNSKKQSLIKVVTFAEPIKEPEPEPMTDETGKILTPSGISTV